MLFLGVEVWDLGHLSETQKLKIRRLGCGIRLIVERAKGKIYRGTETLVFTLAGSGPELLAWQV